MMSNPFLDTECSVRGSYCDSDGMSHIAEKVFQKTKFPS